MLCARQVRAFNIKANENAGGPPNQLPHSRRRHNLRFLYPDLADLARQRHCFQRNHLTSAARFGLHIHAYNRLPGLAKDVRRAFAARKLVARQTWDAFECVRALLQRIPDRVHRVSDEYPGHSRHGQLGTGHVRWSGGIGADLLRDIRTQDLRWTSGICRHYILNILPGGKVRSVVEPPSGFLTFTWFVMSTHAYGQQSNADGGE